VPSLSLIEAPSGSEGHEGEVCACAFTPDGSQVLSGGWDKQLRLWETGTPRLIKSFEAGKKPISACAISPDGRYFFSGCLEGLLARWDASTCERISLFLAHGRPISAIVFAADSKAVITSSWDANVIVWNPAREFEGKTLSGHRDIVAGCKLTPDGQTILSWSHDGTLRLWGVARHNLLAKLAGHNDRVTAAGISPDGRLAVSGSRDGSLKLWDLQSSKEVASVELGCEVRGCLFLRHGQTIAAVDANGRCTFHSSENLEEQEAISTNRPVVCADIAPAGNLIALGCTDGQLRFVEIREFDRFPLWVTAIKTSRRQSTRLQRMFGRSKVIQAYICTCPACRHSLEIPRADTAEVLRCPGCQRSLRIAEMAKAAPERALRPVAL
jgi:WD40 repeat protein